MTKKQLFDFHQMNHSEIIELKGKVIKIEDFLLALKEYLKIEANENIVPAKKELIDNNYSKEQKTVIKIKKINGNR